MIQELTDEQRRAWIDAVQRFEAFLEARDRRNQYSGSLGWARRGDREYLIKKGGQGRKTRSLGPRSAETERILEEFARAKASAEERYHSLRKRIAVDARISRAHHIGRVPTIAANVIRHIERNEQWRGHLLIVGTHALYAYEARAGVQVDSGLLATGDLDVLWDARRRLRVVGAVPEHGFLGLLRKVDRTFERSDNARFSAVNGDGYQVDLIQPQPPAGQRILVHEQLTELPDDLLASEIRGLSWLVSAPRMRQIAIAQDGYPLTLLVPDPRAWALHKRWVAGQPDRDPVKQHRDLRQAECVAYLLANYLVDLRVDERFLRCFPEALRRDHGAGLVPGIDDL